jgi:hypothetical protein
MRVIEEEVRFHTGRRIAITSLVGLPPVGAPPVTLHFS